MFRPLYTAPAYVTCFKLREKSLWLQFSMNNKFLHRHCEGYLVILMALVSLSLDWMDPDQIKPRPNAFPAAEIDRHSLYSAPTSKNSKYRVSYSRGKRIRILGRSMNPCVGLLWFVLVDWAGFGPSWIRGQLRPSLAVVEITMCPHFC